MFSLHNFFYGLVLAALGTAGLKYTFQILNFTGRQDWIEDHLGGGTTYMAYKLFFLLLVLLGLILALGLANSIFVPLFSPLKGIFGGAQ